MSTNVNGGDLRFSFVNKTQNIDWKLLNSINLDEIEKNLQINSLQNCLSSLIYADITKDFNDASFIKIFKIAQYTIEYLLFSQNVLNKEIESLKNEKNKYIGEINSLKDEINSSRKKIEDIKRECHRRKLLMIAQQNLLNSQPSDNFDCLYCTKKFINKSYLLAHIERRHPKSFDKENSSFPLQRPNMESTMIKNNETLADATKTEELKLISENIKTIVSNIEKIDRTSTYNKDTIQESNINLEFFKKSFHREINIVHDMLNSLNEKLDNSKTSQYEFSKANSFKLSEAKISGTKSAGEIEKTSEKYEILNTHIPSTVLGENQIIKTNSMSKSINKSKIINQLTLFTKSDDTKTVKDSEISMEKNDRPILDTSLEEIAQLTTESEARIEKGINETGLRTRSFEKSEKLYEKDKTIENTSMDERGIDQNSFPVNENSLKDVEKSFDRGISFDRQDSLNKNNNSIELEVISPIPDVVDNFKFDTENTTIKKNVTFSENVSDLSYKDKFKEIKMNKDKLNEFRNFLLKRVDENFANYGFKLDSEKLSTNDYAEAVKKLEESRFNLNERYSRFTKIRQLLEQHVNSKAKEIVLQNLNSSVDSEFESEKTPVILKPAMEVLNESLDDD